MNTTTHISAQTDYAYMLRNFEREHARHKRGTTIRTTNQLAHKLLSTHTHSYKHHIGAFLCVVAVGCVLVSCFVGSL